MKIFRNERKYKICLICVSLLSAILAYRGLCNRIEVNIYQVYNIAIGDIIIMGFIIPVFSLLIIKMINAVMRGSILLAQNTRRMWWINVNKKILQNSFLSAGIIILPIFILYSFMSGKVRSLGEYLYGICLITSYFLFFYFLGICIIIIKLKFHSSILAFCLVIIISYLPNMVGYLYGCMTIPTISEVLNVSYAIHENTFYWFYGWKTILFMAFLLFVLNEIVEIIIKKIDIFWTM